MIINCNVLVEVLKPFLIKMGVISQDELECLRREATIEMLSDGFCGVVLAECLEEHKTPSASSNSLLSMRCRTIARCRF